MQMCPGGCGTCVSQKGYGCAGSDLVSCFLEQFFIVAVDGNDVSFVLNLYAVAALLIPLGGNDGAIQNCLDNCTAWCCDIYIWMKIRVISL